MPCRGIEVHFYDIFEQVRFLARSFAVPGNHPGQQSTGMRWPYGPVSFLPTHIPDACEFKVSYASDSELGLFRSSQVRNITSLVYSVMPAFFLTMKLSQVQRGLVRWQ